MRNRIIRGIATALSVFMIAGVLGGCTDTASVSNSVGEPNTVQGSFGMIIDTLVVGCGNFSGNFSPFYATTEGDEVVLKLTMQPLMAKDRNGEMVKLGIDGQVGSYKGTYYKYYGLTDCVVTKKEDGTVDYAFTLRDGVKCSDSVPLTVDDIIFTMYILSDPLYDGPSEFSKLPIDGMKKYQSDMDTLFNLLVKAGRDNEDFAYWDKDTQEKFWEDMDIAGEKFVSAIVDKLKNAGYNSTKDSVADCMKNWGFDVSENSTELDVFHDLVEYYNGDIVGMSKVENVGLSIMDLMDNYSDYNKVINTDAKIDNISGIKKIDDKNFVITMTEFDTKSIYGLDFYVAPLHYYGDKSLYDYENNKFGFEKGNLLGIKQKNEPVGFGAYKFAGYEDESVLLEVSDYFWKETAKIPKVQLVCSDKGSKLNDLVIKKFDITDIELTPTVLGMIKEINSNGEITGEKISSVLYDKPGYGYIGISAANVKVGKDKSSQESKALRNAFATLFAFYRDEVIKDYYDEMASVIEYPVSVTFWGAPQKNAEGYKRAYSTDIDQNAIYTLDMDRNEREKAVIGAAVSFFKAAGYTYDDGKKTFTDAPEGAKMKYEVLVPAKGTGDHPSYAIFTKAKSVLSDLGIELVIKDISDTNYLWEALDMDTAEIWAAAWGAAVEPNLYQNYHSDNYFSGRYSNYYGIQDDDLDRYIEETSTIVEETSRVASFKNAFDTIMSWGVEVPVYERKNAYLYNTSKLDSETLPTDMTVFWDWTAEIEKLDFKRINGPAGMLP